MNERSFLQREWTEIVDVALKNQGTVTTTESGREKKPHKDKRYKRERKKRSPKINKTYISFVPPWCRERNQKQKRQLTISLGKRRRMNGWSIQRYSVIVCCSRC